MSKRGRPSKKVLKKREQAKAKARKMLIFAILLIVALVVLGIFIMNSQNSNI